VVVNQQDGVEQAVSCVISIITAEKCRGKQRRVEV